ncbi:creatininase family protein [Saccharopolyspora cebuensis]|uniref:Creatininase family protein n=1 Tax=Saccharopolyspora cebuensis TaxID=418759 RepID=A0ABV4CGA4_9PSEU
MPPLLPTATAREEEIRDADVAVLPVGSFEQHGRHLPLATDTIIASLLADELAKHYDGLRVLPAVPFGCSHEHAGILGGTVSISATTLHRLVNDILDDLEQQGITRAVILHGHGGNYVLQHLAQEASAGNRRRVLLWPNGRVWDQARTAAECELNAHEDMHAGEGETSLLLHAFPGLVGDQRIDERADDRPDLLLHGLRAYTTSGVVGAPSAATADKGRALLEAFVAEFARPLAELRRPMDEQTSH